jgi:hypothetical protein
LPFLLPEKGLRMNALNFWRLEPIVVCGNVKSERCVCKVQRAEESRRDEWTWELAGCTLTDWTKRSQRSHVPNLAALINSSEYSSPPFWIPEDNKEGGVTFRVCKQSGCINVFDRYIRDISLLDSLTLFIHQSS